MSRDRPLIMDFKITEIPATRYAVNILRKEMSIDLSPMQCEVFILLEENGGGMTQRALEECLDISKSTLSGVLKTMEKRGFVEKTVSDSDRRVMEVSLSPRGREIYGEAMRRMEDLDRTVFAGLDEEELRVMAKALAAIRRNIASDS